MCAAAAGRLHVITKPEVGFRDRPPSASVCSRLDSTCESASRGREPRGFDAPSGIVLCRAEKQLEFKRDASVLTKANNDLRAQLLPPPPPPAPFFLRFEVAGLTSSAMVCCVRWSSREIAHSPADTFRRLAHVGIDDRTDAPVLVLLGCLVLGAASLREPRHPQLGLCRVQALLRSLQNNARHDRRLVRLRRRRRLSVVPRAQRLVLPPGEDRRRLSQTPGGAQHAPDVPSQVRQRPRPPLPHRPHLHAAVRPRGGQEALAAYGDRVFRTGVPRPREGSLVAAPAKAARALCVRGPRVQASRALHPRHLVDTVHLDGQRHRHRVEAHAAVVARGGEGSNPGLLRSAGGRVVPRRPSHAPDALGVLAVQREQSPYVVAVSVVGFTGRGGGGKRRLGGVLLGGGRVRHGQIHLHRAIRTAEGQ
eukprot:121122-Prorocentrum_minimum.AAC.3